MKTITIRDLRQRWPEAEAALQVEDELIITRDSKPVAKLVRITAEAPKRPRWNAAEHARWQRKVSRGKVSRSDEALGASRADRVFPSNALSK
jgi:antitoxin (DNA-binding transcriptional repressor) of toxin-antitoxin stability system